MLLLPIRIKKIILWYIYGGISPSVKVYTLAVSLLPNKHHQAQQLELRVRECVSVYDASSSVEILSHKEAYKCTTISCHIKELADLFLLINCRGP